MEAMASRIFLKSAILLLVLTAVGKVVSIVGDQGSAGPALWFFSQRSVQGGAAALEVSVALFAWTRLQRPIAALGVIAGWCFVIVAYRIGLWVGDIHVDCGCLGWLAGAMRLDRDQASFVAEGILIYVMAGSYVLLARTVFDEARQTASRCGEMKR